MRNLSEEIGDVKVSDAPLFQHYVYIPLHVLKTTFLNITKTETGAIACGFGIALNKTQSKKHTCQQTLDYYIIYGCYQFCLAIAS